MSEAKIKHNRTMRASSLRHHANQLSQRIVFFFDLELLLPVPIRSPKLMAERLLQPLVRKRDRIIWTATGFFLVVNSSDQHEASVAAERVRQHLMLKLSQKGRVQSPLADRAVRLTALGELRQLPLMSG